MSKSSRYTMIFFWIILMVAAIFIISRSLDNDMEEMVVLVNTVPPSTELQKEYAVFERTYASIKNQPTEIPAKYERSLNEYYNNRAYSGAPPTIPHPVSSEDNIGGKSCLQCHQNGGFVAKFDAYAPITPHPEFESCKQCHVPKTTNGKFKGHNWQPAEAPEIGNTALISSPPVIPHDLQYRSNCLACHGGAAAPKEIRVSHPERSNCRQCHVPVNQAKLVKYNASSESISWTRKPTE